jgi:branched-chain amino acid transport system ATP-binding protein
MALEVRDLSVWYGQIRVLFGVNLRVDDREIVSLIGPNGAGKTTTLEAIAGLLARDGEVCIDGEVLSPVAPQATVARGLVLVPQGRRIFPSMTVEENLLLGGFSHALTWRKAETAFEPIFEYFPRLKERRRQAAGKLSGGEQQMLVLGRALLAQPSCILIDELSLGLAPKFVELLLEIIVRLNQEIGTTFLLVEQAAAAALDISNRAYLLKKGEMVFDGSATELKDQVDVLRSAYLGARPTAVTATTSQR